MSPLSPLVSAFDTLEEAEAYDRWLRAKVEAALADLPSPVLFLPLAVVASASALCAGGLA